MSWQGFLNGDRLEQEQLEVIHALIEDAAKETALWCQADPSAEERVHVLGMEEWLADLDRIIARRMEGRPLPRDDWRWSQTVLEVLSRLEKAREVRGNVVGKALASLADRLPKELPRPKVLLGTQAPAPPRTRLGGSGIAPYSPKPTHRPPSPPAYFPSDLWPRTVVILDKACKRFPDQRNTLELCKYVISEMTPLFCEAVEAGKMEASAVLAERFGGIEDLLDSLLAYNCDHDNERFRLKQEARNSDEYRRLARAIEKAGRLRTDANQAESSLVQNNAKATQSPESKSADRHAMVKAYIDEVLSKTGKRISKKDIWSKAGYQTRTEFERWERQDSKHPNRAADETFTRILCVEKPHLK